MATNQETESPPPYSVATAEELNAIDTRIAQQMLATQELNGLFLPRHLMVAMSIGLFLSALFMILAGEVTTKTLRWDLLAKICFVTAGGIMSGPLWMAWQRHDVQQTHAQRSTIQNDSSYIEKAPEKAESESVDRDQKDTIDPEVEGQGGVTPRYSNFDIACILWCLFTTFLGWLMTFVGMFTAVIGFPLKIWLLLLNVGSLLMLTSLVSLAGF